MPKINLSKLTPKEKQELKAKLEALVAEKKKEKREKEYEEAPIMEMKGVNEIVKAIKQLEAKVEVNVPKVDPTPVTVNQELKLSQEAFNMLASLKGEPGPAGRDGKTPIRGVDYLTFEDKREMAVDAINILEGFEGDDRLDAKAIKNIEDNIDIDKLKIPQFNFDDYKNDFISLLPNNPPQNAGGSGATFLKSMRDFDVPREESRTDGYAITWNASKNKFDLQQGGGGGAWGSITGTLSDQTDLQTALDAKQPLDAQLTSLAGLTPGIEGRLITSDGLGGFQMTAPSSFITDNSILVSGDNVSSLVNDAGYLTSYTETQTLQDVTDLGATTTNPISITSTSSQLELAYDGTTGVDFTVDATDNFTIASQGAGGYFAQGFNQTIASSGNSILLGNQLVANGATNSVVMGISASATAGDSVVQGYLASTQSARTVVMGALSSASGASAGDSVTIGYNSTTSGRYSVTLGRGVTNAIQNTFQVGFNGNQSFFVNSNSNLMLNSATLPSAGTHYDTSATNTLTMHVGTAPSGVITDAVQMYVQDNGAGNAGLVVLPEVGTEYFFGTNAGIGTLTPNALLHVDKGGGTTPAIDAGTLAVFQNNSLTTDNAAISIIGGTSGDASIFFGTSADENAGEIRYETSTNPDRWSLYVEGGTINVRHSNTQHIFYKSGSTAVQIYDFFTSTVMSGASGASPWMWFNTSYNITRPQYSSYQDTDTGLAFPSAGLIQLTVGGTEKVKLNNSGQLLVNGSGFTQLYQTQITTTDDAIVDSDTMDVSGTTLLIHRNDNTNNAGCALGFAGGTANTNIGAMIAFERTNTNSQGRLRFGVKTDTGSGSDIEDNMAINDDGKVHFFDDSIVVSTSKTPANASDTGTQGEVAWDANYIYVCTATNTWVRAALSTW